MGVRIFSDQKMRLAPALFATVFGKDYSGYKVLRASWKDPAVSQEVFDFLERSETADLWVPEHVENVFDTKAADFIISPEEAVALEKSDLAHLIEYDVMISDAGKLIDVEKEQTRMRKARRLSPRDYPLNEYLTFEELEEWMADTVDDNSDKTELTELGETYEGKKIWGFHMGDKNHAGSKKKIFMDCTCHAREWIAPAMCRYFIHSVLTAANGGSIAENLPYTDEDLAGLLDFNWYIIVVANPDGYAYSHDRDRMWRKNRSLHSGQTCYGTDLNRNFPIGWGTTGGSSNQCSSTYAGPAAFSENEAVAWDNWLKELQGTGGDVAAVISIHSYSQLLMPPWATGRRTNERPQNPPTIDYMTRVTNKMADELKKAHGKTYRVGQSRDVVGYAAGGTTEDYAYERTSEGGRGVDLAWVYELRDTGTFGFLLPASQIVHTSEENIASFMPMADEIRNPTGP